MEFDYIVAGGGAAGCVLAARLSEDPSIRVLVLEAGGSAAACADWGLATVPQAHLNGRVLRYTQAKGLGGGSALGGQIYTRGNARDYDAWAQEDGCTGWSYADLLPFFRRAEDNNRFSDVFHGTGGPLGVAAPAATKPPIAETFLLAAQQAGLPYNPDFNGARQRGVGHYQMAVAGYLPQARARRNLFVRTGATVLRVLVERGAAVGVDVLEGGRAAIVRCTREVIVASGAIGSPRLLLLSGIGPAHRLRAVGVDVIHDLPGVGENLQDHVCLSATAERRGVHRAGWSGLRDRLFGYAPAVETGGFASLKAEAEYPDVQFHLGLGAGVTLGATYLRPRARGSVRLASADPRAAPLVDPNHWSDPLDRRLSLAGLRMARNILRQPALHPFIVADQLSGAGATSEADIIDHATQIARAAYHAAGTCRMGEGPMAVVGPDLRVHGLGGLRVIDASVMPRIVSSGTAAAAMAIGEKGSDLIRGSIYPSAALPAA